MLLILNNKIVLSIKIKYCEGFYGTNYIEFYNHKEKFIFLLTYDLEK